MSVSRPPRPPKSRRATSSTQELILPTPEEYAEFIRQIDLMEIWLIEARVQNRHGPGMPRQAALAIEAPGSTWETVDGGFDVRFPYVVKFIDAPTVHAEITVIFGVRFSSTAPLTESIFEVFKDVNLPVNTWPFLREFVSTTLGRMGWQPFTLPAFKQGIPDDNNDEEDTARPKRRRAPSKRAP